MNQVHKVNISQHGKLVDTVYVTGSRRAFKTANIIRSNTQCNAKVTLTQIPGANLLRVDRNMDDTDFCEFLDMLVLTWK